MNASLLKPTDILLVGRLVILDEELKSIRPHLGIDVRCRWCRRRHNHGWSDPPFPPDEVEWRDSHCTRRGAPSGYFIGLDRSQSWHNREVVARVRKLQEEWDRRNEARSRETSPTPTPHAGDRRPAQPTEVG